MLKITPLYITILILLFLTGCNNNKSQENEEDYYPLYPNCNVILITMDSLRADHLGVYGYQKNVSPNIDQFASISKVYTDALSQSGSTLFSLPSIHTSKFPFKDCLLYTSPSPRDRTRSRMPSSA